MVLNSENNISNRRQFLALMSTAAASLSGCSESENPRTYKTEVQEVSTITATSNKGSDDVIQWGVFELMLTNTGSYTKSEKYTQVTLYGAFTGPDGQTITVPGFWDGDDTFRIRFSPPADGTWTYETASPESSLDGQFGSFDVVAPTHSQIDSNPNYRGVLRISSTNRYLEYADGTPFLWIGGTCWEEPELSKDDNWKQYVDDRADKGFTLIQMRGAGMRSLEGDTKNESGFPFITEFTEINIPHFQVLDDNVAYVHDSGLVPFFLPMWGPAFNAATQAELEAFHRHVVARYQAYNVIWSISGEYNKNNSCCQRQRALGKFIDSIDGLNHPTSYHPFPGTTMTDFEGESWFDFHQHQTHKKDEYEFLVEDFPRDDGPLVNTEAGYPGFLDHNRLEVRRDMYQVMFSGLAAGYTYGIKGISHEYNGDLSELDHKSGFDVKRIASLLGDIDWWELENDQDIIKSGGGSGHRRKIATYLPDSTREYVYFPVTTDATIGLSHIDATYAELTWFRTSDGSTQSVGTFNTSKTVSLSPPSEWSDALLIAESRE